MTPRLRGTRTIVRAVLLLTVVPPVCGEDDRRLAVPTPAERDAAHKLVKDLYREDFAKARLAPERAALAKKLLEQGRETRDDPSAQFVLLTQARDLAVEGFDVVVAARASEILGDRFRVHPRREVLDMLKAAVKVQGTWDVHQANAFLRMVVAQANAAAGADEVDLAVQFLALAESGAAKGRSAGLTAQAKVLAQTGADLRAAYIGAKPALDQVKEGAATAEDRAAAGRFRALFLGDWKQGLPLLTAGTDDELRRLIRLEGDQAGDAGKQVALGDAWWARAEKEKTGTAKGQLMRRATTWYEAALPSLTGLNRKKAEQRVAEAGKAVCLGRVEISVATAAVAVAAPPPAPPGEVRQFGDRSNRILCAAFSPDGKFVIAGGSADATDRKDYRVRGWDVTTGKQVVEFAGHTGEVWSVDIGRDGMRAASSGQDATVRLWDARTGKEVARGIGHRANVTSVRFSADGRYVVSASDDHMAIVWDARTGREVLRFTGHTDAVRSAVFSHDQKWVFTGGHDKSIRRWDAKTGKEVQRLESETPVVCLAVASDGDTLISTSDGGTSVIRIWSVKAGTQVRTLPVADQHLVAIAISPDGKRFLAGSPDIRLWDLAEGTEITKLSGHDGAVYGVAFSPDGSHAVSGGLHDRTVRLWRLPPVVGPMK